MALIVLPLLLGGHAAAEVNLVQTVNDKQEGVDSVFAVFDQPPAEGNLLVAVAGNRDGSAAPTTPSGWSVALSSPSGSPGQIVYYRIAGPAEPSTVIVKGYPITSRRGLHLYEYSGVDTSDVLEDSDEATGSGTNVSAGSVTAAGEALVVTAVTINANSHFSGWADSFTEQQDFVNAGTPTTKSTGVPSEEVHSTSVDGGQLTTGGVLVVSISWARNSPSGLSAVWMFTYNRPAIRSASWVESSKTFPTMIPPSAGLGAKRCWLLATKSWITPALASVAAGPWMWAPVTSPVRSVNPKYEP